MSFFRPYPAYKDSGVEWIGEIPEHWEARPLKAFVALIESGTSVNADDRPASDGEFGLLKTSCVYTGEFDPDQNKAVVPEEYEHLSCPLRANALIVSRMNTPDLVGAAGLVRDCRAEIFLPDRLWQIVLHNCDPIYALYWTHTAKYRGQIKSACSGTSSSMKKLSQGQFLNLAFLRVPLPEQLAIVNFLDRETKKIDALVAEQERLMALLKEKRQAVISLAVTKGLNPNALMKDSGVEWIGKVPISWSVKRVKYVARLESGHTPSKQFPEYLENGDIE